MNFLSPINGSIGFQKSLSIAAALAACALLAGCGGGGSSTPAAPNNYAGTFDGNLGWTDNSGAHTTTVHWVVDTSGHITGTDTYFGTDSGTVTNQGAIDVYVGTPPTSSSPQMVVFFRNATVNVAGSLVTSNPVATYGLTGTLTRS